MLEDINILLKDWGACLTVKDGNKLADPEILQKVTDLINHLRQINKKRLLIYGLEKVQMKDKVDLYQEIDLFQKLGGNGFKVAFVAPNRINDELSDFANVVGLNRGVFINYLANETEALAWLLS